MEYTVVLIDNPAPHVRRVTLNRPEKRNALNSVLRQEIITAVREGETDPDVRVTVIAANGPSFCAGYDLTQNIAQAGSGVPAADYPYAGAGGFQRSVVDLWTSMWDLSKPVIAQVHGHCLAGGSELATGCDLVYVAADARIGYPAVRFGTPDMQYHAWLMGMRRGMELMLTGDSMTGVEAADWGFANQQAHRASRHGSHGHAPGAPGRHRAVDRQLPQRGRPGVHRQHPRAGPDRGAEHP
jgi:enoyl-CoA hydratase